MSDGNIIGENIDEILRHVFHDRENVPTDNQYKILINGSKEKLHLRCTRFTKLTFFMKPSYIKNLCGGI